MFHLETSFNVCGLLGDDAVAVVVEEFSRFMSGRLGEFYDATQRRINALSTNDVPGEYETFYINNTVSAENPLGVIHKIPARPAEQNFDMSN